VELGNQVPGKPRALLGKMQENGAKEEEIL